MNDLLARDVDQIRNYLLGRLSEEEELAFQDRLAREPMLVHELEQSLQMREGLRQLQAQGFPPTRVPHATHSRGMLQWLLPIAAAAVVAGVYLDFWWERASVLTAAPAAHAEGSAARPIAAQFTFVSMRDATRPSLALPASGLIELRAAPETLHARSYRITLLHHQGQLEKSLGSVAGAGVQTDGYLHSFADSARLASGSYSLRIESEGGGSPGAEEFPFTLRAPGSPSP